METISTGVWRHSGFTVWDYKVCQGFLQTIFTGSQKIYRTNLEEGVEKFLMVPEHVQYLADDVMNVLICDRHLSAAHCWNLLISLSSPSRVRAVADITKNPRKTCEASMFGVERMPQCRLMPKL